METLLQRLLFLQQFGNTLSVDVRSLIAALFGSIEADLRRADPTGVLPRYRPGRVDVFLLRTRNRIRDWLPLLTSRMKDHLAVLGRHESVWATHQLMATLGTFEKDGLVRETPVTQARMRAILNTEPFQGRVLKGHAERLGANVVDQLGVQVRLGMAREEPIDDIVRRVRGRGRIGGVLQTTTRHAEALVRTAVTFTSNRGHLDTFRENAEVLDGVRFTATLDDRTTDVCLSLDGTEWELDDPEIVVPGEATHYGCRSVLTALIAWERLGLPRPPVPDRVVRDLSTVTDRELELAVSTRRSRGAFGGVKRISSSQLANEWLRRQRAAVQNRMLGRGRAELFRQGKITVRDLVTSDLRTVPLRDLAS